MESNSRSPIFSGFGELLEGIVTVRAFSAEQRFLDDLHGKIDVTTKVDLRLTLDHAMILMSVATDVVQFLDDESVAPVELRYAGRAGCVNYHSPRTVWLCQGWYCWSVYHERDDVHDERLLGLSVLDRP